MSVRLLSVLIINVLHGSFWVACCEALLEHNDLRALRVTSIRAIQNPASLVVLLTPVFPSTPVEPLPLSLNSLSQKDLTSHDARAPLDTVHLGDLYYHTTQ